MSPSTVDATLEPVAVGDITGQFFIPDYQRGYRWGGEEVTTLLQDIDDAKGDAYYLQPIVVKAMSDGRWELIDGQQRLTTLYLILRYIREEILPSAPATYSLDYETRPGSADYLDQIDPDRRNDNIDFFHIAEAYDAITAWFDAHAHRKVKVALDLYSALAETVKVIRYQASEEIDSTTLFTRLNVGRIPLTDAELVKALLLSSGHGDTRRAQEIAAHWDLIERDLRRPDLWAFITGSAEGGATRIDLLLDSIVGGPTGRDRPRFHTFEQLRIEVTESGALAVWDAVADQHDLITAWFDDRDLFHKIGYLIATGTTLPELVALARDETRSRFDTLLNDRIRQRLNLSADALRDLTYHSTSASGRRADHALLLMNVETIRQNRHSSERYSFAAHAARTWSLEHIHAQLAEGLTRADQWEEWIRRHQAALASLPHLAPETRASLDERIEAALESITEVSFRRLEQEISELFQATDDTGELAVDSIANLALLDSGDNAALSNSVFEVKRREILERDRAGSYIPVCTRNVFLKYYAEGQDLQPHFWGPADRQGYLSEMVRILSPYLSGESAAADPAEADA